MTHIRLLTMSQQPAVATEACVLQFKEGPSIHGAQEVPEQGPQLATLTSETAKCRAGSASRSSPR